MISHGRRLVLLGLLVFSASLQVDSHETIRDVPGPQAETHTWDALRSARNVPQAEKTRDINAPQADLPIRMSARRVPQAEKARNTISISHDVPQAEFPFKKARSFFESAMNVPQAERALNKRDQVKRSGDQCMWRCKELLHACQERCTAGDEECWSVCVNMYSGKWCRRRCLAGELD